MASILNPLPPTSAPAPSASESPTTNVAWDPQTPEQVAMPQPPPGADGMQPQPMPQPPQGFTVLPQPNVQTNTNIMALVQQLAALGDDSYTTDALSSAGDDTLSSASVEPETAGVGDELEQTTINLYPSGTPSASDVNQHGLGDCYLDSVLAGMAVTPSGQSAIENAISTNSSTNPPTYTVHMYAPDGSPVDVSVDGEMDSQGVTNSSGQMDWASVMEKAFAKYNDTYHVTSGGAGYAGIANGGASDVVMEAFTGKVASTTDISGMSASDVASQMQGNLADGKVVTAGSNSTVTLPDGTEIVGDHAYTVEKVNADGTVTLRNPWGSDPGTNGDGTITITADQFQQCFGTVWAG